jgi:hypothetical protein
MCTQEFIVSACVCVKIVHLSFYFELSAHVHIIAECRPRTHANMHACTHARTHTHTNPHARTHARMHVHTHTHTHTYLHHVDACHCALGRWLEHHSIACHQGRRHFADGQVDGVIEGGDAQDHAQGDLRVKISTHMEAHSGC